MEANCLVLSDNKGNCFFLQYIIKLVRENWKASGYENARSL